MAQAIICDVCETAAADFLVTNLQDGSTFAACGLDYSQFMRSMVAAMPDEAEEPAPEAPAGDEIEREGEAPTYPSPAGQPKSETEQAQEQNEGAEPADNATAATAND